jgi:hypothetical protein
VQLATIFLSTWLLLAAVQQLPAEAGETLALRWLRKCAEHPLRCATAAALAGWALRPARAAPEQNPMQPAAAGAESSEQARADQLGGADRFGPGSALPRLLD